MVGMATFIPREGIRATCRPVGVGQSCNLGAAGLFPTILLALVTLALRPTALRVRRTGSGSSAMTGSAVAGAVGAVVWLFADPQRDVSHVANVYVDIGAINYQQR
jgi:hypothetical protein